MSPVNTWCWQRIETSVYRPEEGRELTEASSLSAQQEYMALFLGQTYRRSLAPGGSRWKHSAVLWKDRMYVFGGKNGKYHRVEVLDLSTLCLHDTFEWQSMTTINEESVFPMEYCCACLWPSQQAAVVVGSRPYLFYLEQRRWTPLPPMDLSLSPGASVNHVPELDAVIVLSGAPHHVRLLHYNSNAQEYEWDVRTTLGAPECVSSFSRHSAQLIANRLYVFGLFNHSISMIYLDLNTYLWHVVEASLRPQPRWMHGSVTVSATEFIVFGGFDDVPLQDLWIYDTEESLWTPLIIDRIAFEMSSSSSSSSSSDSSDDENSLSCSRQQKSNIHQQNIPGIPRRRSWPSMVRHQGFVYLFGGANSRNAMADVWRLRVGLDSTHFKNDVNQMWITNS